MLGRAEAAEEAGGRRLVVSIDDLLCLKACLQVVYQEGLVAR
jgi:hypothetical protein